MTEIVLGSVCAVLCGLLVFIVWSLHRRACAVERTLTGQFNRVMDRAMCISDQAMDLRKVEQEESSDERRRPKPESGPRLAPLDPEPPPNYGEVSEPPRRDTIG